jgi:hypothetical protein
MTMQDVVAAVNDTPQIIEATTKTAAAVSLYDARPFFEKALVYGVHNNIIDAAKLEAIAADAPKGMVQIARYFGNENLRPELEAAKDRMVNLVSLYLQSSCSGDLRQAAQQLQDHSFLSRSKGGSDMLKALIGMPTSTHFGMGEHVGFTDKDIPLLAKWALRSLADYQTELAKRGKVGLVIDAALWLADTLGMDPEVLEEAGKDAEAVIRTALLSLACKRNKMPDWAGFDKIVLALRKKDASSITIALPAKLPTQFKDVVNQLRLSVVADLPKICDATLPTRKLFDQTPAFMGRYFWIEDALAEVEHYERTISSEWSKATSGHTDDSSLLTVLLCIAAQLGAKTMLTTKAAATLVRKVRKSGWQPQLAVQFIQTYAPEQDQNDYLRLWADFVADAQPILQSEFDYALKDAQALLARNCNVA